MTRRATLLVISGALLLVGIALFVLPTPGEPSLDCVAEGQPSSGFADADQGDCPISIESYDAYREWASGPRWDNIAGLVLVLGAIGTGVAALVVARKDERRAAASPAGPPPDPQPDPRSGSGTD